ncbi:RNA-directed DNA polymerase, eukaryota [Tanacetum coccineum]
MATSFRSNADHTRLISKSIFVTNFPDSTTSKDLWKLCQSYGTVVDVYIPNRKSKAGKRFAFIRFIKVDNIDRLVGNLCTLWIGRFHLHANVVRFERSPMYTSRSSQPVHSQPVNHVTPVATSFVSAVKGLSVPPSLSKPALVLDDSCLVSRDLENFVMGEVLQFSSINNLRVLLSNEGFHNAHIVYLGGLWVMIELVSSKAKLKLMNHVGVASWFRCLCNAQSDFVAKERIVWIDIEGVPLHAWSRSTFFKIGSKWGEVMELEDGHDDLFARKRLCVKTKQEVNILENFKIIVKGKVFCVRAKELFVWSPTFKDTPEVGHCSDDDPIKGDAEINGEACNLNNGDDATDSEVVSDTYFGDNADEQGYENDQGQSSNAKEVSNDPFNIYDLLNKRKKDVDNSGTDTSLPYPPGFTPDKSTHVVNEHVVPDVADIRSHSRSEGCNSRILEEVENLDGCFSSEGRSNGAKPKEGGSILEILDEMIKVGQTMGFSMEGLGSKAKKDWIRELTTKHKVSFLTLQETKMELISAMDVKLLWGNYNFDHIFSEALGNSGGILCTWDTNIFHKEHHIISDNFVAFYISSLIARWNGDCLVMGDFNEVRYMEERWGSIFNVHGANAFNTFISSSGLTDVQLEGYSFTWTHPSAAKMSKLDRFLVSDGLLSSFLHISVICLDRHLLDHRPILLRELISDFGAIPFWFYHSWFGLSGFEQMVTNTWNSIVLDDNNGMIRFKKKLQMLKKEIRVWVTDFKRQQVGHINDLKSKLSDIDKLLDQGKVTDDILLSRMETMKHLHDVQSLNNHVNIQKAKVRWAIEGDENTKFFHATINKKRANLSVKGIMVDGDWVVDPSRIKDEFRNHFAARFQDPGTSRGSLNFTFPNRLTLDQVSDLESLISRDEIRSAVCGCDEDKSPGPDGFTFEFFRKFWAIVGPDFCIAVEWDYLDDALSSLFWSKMAGIWIRGSLNSGNAFFSQWEADIEFPILSRELDQDRLFHFQLFLADDGGVYCVNVPYNLKSSIINEVNSLKAQGVDLISHCKIRVGNGMNTSFWNEFWIGDSLLKHLFPRLYALESVKDISVADKFRGPITSSFRRTVRGGVESQQLDLLLGLLGSVLLSNMGDRRVWDLNGDGVFRVKDVRNLLDETFLPKAEMPTRWIKCIPIKVNVFVWKALLDCLPTRLNLARRNVVTASLSCPVCDAAPEDTSHLFFSCSVAREVARSVCRWWDLGSHSFNSYAEWLVWFNSIRLGAKSKEVLEGIFYVSWWSLWNFRNHLLFAVKKPRKDAIFDEIVLRSFNWCLARVLTAPSLAPATAYCYVSPNIP